MYARASSSSPPLVSVVIPALNEAECLPSTLQSIRAQPESHEIIVVDGGSSDATVEIAREYGQVIRADRGRARQMNAGARAASGQVLLFLHADTRLPEGALRAIRETLEQPAVVAGNFRLRFDEQSPLLRFYAGCTRLRSPLLCFGDRGLFVKRRAFEEVSGYPDISIFEDVEIVRLLHAAGRFAYLPDEVTTSARRFRQNGPLQQQLKNFHLWLRYVCGADPDRLARLYTY